MANPVLAPDGNFYELSFLKSHPSFQSFSEEGLLPQLKLKTTIKNYGKRTSKRMAVLLKRTRPPPEGMLRLTAECLSVLQVESAMRVFWVLRGEVMKEVVGSLRDLVPIEWLLSLLRRLAERLPSQALCLARLLLMEPQNEEEFEAAIRTFTGILGQAGVRAKAIDLIEEVAGKLDGSKLSLMVAALSPEGWRIQDRVDELRLKEAYLRLSEGDAEGARSVMKSLPPIFKERVIEFYQHAGWDDDKAAYLAEQQASEEGQLSLAVPCNSPSFFYNYSNKCILHMTNVHSGAQKFILQGRHESRLYASGVALSLLPGELLFIVGGNFPGDDKARTINVFRDLSMTFNAPMLTSRRRPCAVFHAGYVYVLGGLVSYVQVLHDCERYVCAEDRWEALPPLPTACYSSSGVVAGHSLYALGGQVLTGASLASIQKLSLIDLTWDLLQLSLPYQGCRIPVFKLSDTQVCFVMKATLYSFQPHLVQPVKKVPDVRSYGGPSLYVRGTLYCSSRDGPFQTFEIRL